MEPTRDQLKQVVFTFLKQQHMGVISTVSPSITPESANVSYLFDDDWSIYILSHKDSRKVTNIRTNPAVAFVVGTTLLAHTAQIEGTAQIIDEMTPEYQIITQKFDESKILQLDPIFGVYKDNYVILKITISWLRWLYFEQQTNKEVYTVLIP